MIYTTIYRCLRASTLVVLNRNIAIFITTKYQNVPYNGRAKVIFFGSAAKVFFYLCIHTVFNYFTHFFLFLLFFFFYIAVWTLYIVCAFTLLLFFYSYIFFFSYILFFYLCVHTTIVVDILFCCDVYIILLY